eukprot:6171872-Pleurochrysis_carterae.AAC.1
MFARSRRRMRLVASREAVSNESIDRARSSSTTVQGISAALVGQPPAGVDAARWQRISTRTRRAETAARVRVPSTRSVSEHYVHLVHGSGRDTFSHGSCVRGMRLRSCVRSMQLRDRKT